VFATKCGGVVGYDGERRNTGDGLMSEKSDGEADEASFEGDGIRPAADATRMLDMIHANWMSQVITVAAELGLSDVMAGGIHDVETMASATGCHAHSLRRLLRALTSLGLCREIGKDSFDVTPTGALLRTGTPDSLRSWALWWGSQLAPVWAFLGHSVKNGVEARTLATGRAGFSAISQDSTLAARFHLALSDLSRRDAAAIIDAFDFSGIAIVADIGAGHGHLLAMILRAHPEARGLLLDLPHALDYAREHLDQLGVANRCEFLVGDFFVSVPHGADVYLLKSVLHDWQDERAVAILRNCRDAMSTHARLVLIEVVLPERIEARWQHQILAREDLSMMILHGSHERTLAEWHTLIEGAGLRVANVIPTSGRFSMIEAVVSA
jgi:hypothetical protein